MKITLDLTALVEEGKLTRAEAERLEGLAARQTGSLGINIVLGFGLVAVAAGIGALIPSPVTAVALGLALAVLGFALLSAAGEAWFLLGKIALVIGTLAFCGGVIVMGEGSIPAVLFSAVVMAAAGTLAQSALLVGIAVLALGATLGSSTDYSHAFYALSVEKPTLTIAVFSALAFAAYEVSQQVRAAYERLALVAARVAVFMVNFGFWIGSLWGDQISLPRLGLRADDGGSGFAVPAVAFSVLWALALVAVGIWSVRANRRWVANVVAVFGGIHFYTQWFERLGASPESVLIAGLLLLGVALGLYALNRRWETSPSA